MCHTARLSMNTRMKERHRPTSTHYLREYIMSASGEDRKRAAQAWAKALSEDEMLSRVAEMTDSMGDYMDRALIVNMLSRYHNMRRKGKEPDA